METILESNQTIDESDTTNQKISIPSKKNWPALLFGTAWLGAWYFGLDSALKTFSYDAQPIVLTALGVWLIAGITVGLFVLWGYLGREEVRFQQEEILIKKNILGLGITKKIPSHSIQSVSMRRKTLESIAVDKSKIEMWLEIWGLSEGKIIVKCESKTYSFAAGLDDFQCNEIIYRIKQNLI